MTVSATDYLAKEAYYNEDYTHEGLESPNATDVENNIIEDTRKRITNFYDVFSVNVATFRFDLLFLYIDQWDPYLRSLRRQKKKTILQINYLKSIIQRLSGQEAESDPDLIVSAPENEDVPEDEVMIKEGLLRQSMYEEKFSYIKSEAFKYALAASYSAILVSYDYKNPKTYDKKLTYRHFPDATVCFWSADCQKADKSDAMICGFFTSLDKAEFNLEFPNSTSDLSFSTLGNSDQIRNQWMDGPKVRIADVWRREKYTDIIVLLSNGESMPEDEVEPYLKRQDSLLRKLREQQRMGAQVPPELMQKVTIEQKEERVCSKIVHYKMVADEILEYNMWPSDMMPLVFVDCESMVIDGLQRTQSFHQVMQDRQRQLNYMASAECDAIMQSHQGNWIGTPDNFDEKILTQWLQPQTPNGLLIAKRDSAGQMPIYIPPPQPSAAFAQQQEAAIRDIYNISGYHDANLGMTGNEQSGTAINNREAAGNLSSFKPFNNLELAIEQCGRIALSLMPAVFDNTRTVTIRTKDGKSLKKLLNEPYLDEMGEEAYQNDMKRQGFDVKIEAGASFAAQKRVAYATLMQFLQAAPQLGPLIYDRILGNMDVDNVKEMVERVQKFLVGMPVPQIISEETGIQIPKQQPNPEAMMAQQQQQLEQKKVQNESDKIALQSQQMVQDALENHAKNVIEVKQFNDELQADMIKSRAEIEKAKIDSHQQHGLHLAQLGLDLHKHHSSMAHQANMAKQQSRLSGLRG